MNKIDLVEALRDSDVGLSKIEAEQSVKMFFDLIADALIKGDRVELRGFCTLFVKEYGSYTGRNPRSGEKVTVAPKKLPFFKPGKELKERLNGVK